MEEGERKPVEVGKGGRRWKKKGGGLFGKGKIGRRVKDGSRRVEGRGRGITEEGKRFRSG